MPVARERTRIVQLIPTSGWVAIYVVDERTTTLGVACWALVEYLDDRSGEERFTVGLASQDGPKLVRADALEGFARYEYTGERLA